ncbi:MAG: hypothetical protein SF162_19640 [bacterium]|nr:hypothetical protein [bacterium]
MGTIDRLNRAVGAALAVLVLMMGLGVPLDAQQITPVPIRPTATPPPLPAQTTAPAAEDARAAVCSAYQLPDFRPVTVMPGDTLAALLNGTAAITITQAAALNCIDDPNTLPVGAVIWLPGAALDAAPADAPPCAYDWIDGIENPLCPPAPPAATYGAVQPFEAGSLVWFADTGLIYALFDDGRGAIFRDTFREGDPDPTAAAPDGLFTPVRGFGAVWIALGGAAGPLGWALMPETGAEIQRQGAGRLSYTTYTRINERVIALSEFPGLETVYWADLTAPE